MKVKKKYVIITFHTSSDALFLEKKAKVVGIICKLIPSPRVLTPGCGMALRVDLIYKEQINKVIIDNNVEIEQVVELEL